jgi:AcrR family transcriptional regulator
MALSLFSEHGFERTTLQEIADRLGFTKAALYYHFPSKDDLLEALIAPALTEIDQLLDAYEAMADSPARRRAFMQEYLDYLLRHRRVIAYITRDLATRAHPLIASQNDERRGRLEAMLLGDQLDLNEKVRVAMTFGGVHAVIAQYPDAPDEELHDALRAAANTLLRARPRGRPSAPRSRQPAHRS